MNGTLVLMEEKPAESLFINMNEADLEKVCTFVDWMSK